MNDKYQEAIDLFEQIYFDENGKLNCYAYNPFEQDSEKYWKLGKKQGRADDGQSKITGRSVFTPRIRRQPIKDEYNPGEVSGYKYFLTLDHQGIFDHHFDAFLLANKGCIKEIDITNMTREEVMTRVREMLHMSNEEVMEQFNIQSTYSTKVKLELLVDDIIHSYFEQKGQEITDKTGGPEWGMRITTEGSMVQQETVGYDSKSLSRIMINPNDSTFGMWEDEIGYNVLTPEENDISKIRISFDDRFTDVNSELGQLIYTTLRERFTERQIEEETQLETGSAEDVSTTLDTLTLEQLENYLQTIQASNESKREEVRKIELIKQIKQAQQEGLQLDAQIRDAKAQNRGE